MNDSVLWNGNEALTYGFASYATFISPTDQQGAGFTGNARHE